MIFLGDVSHPFNQPPSWHLTSLPMDLKQPVVANLEGSLTQIPETLLHQRKLFNHYSVLEAFIHNNVVAVSLANNHITDLSPSSLTETIRLLADAGIESFGAGSNIEKASRPAMLNVNGYEFILLGFGWGTIQCKAATNTRPGVNPLQPHRVLDMTKYWRRKNPTATLIIIMHWNYELELYPQPAHRQLAMAAIDAGADAVIGHHPHRVGGIEIYKNRPIAYSLGNWWMPQGVYFSGKLSFGDETLTQLALEWEPDSEPICHWFEYSRLSHQLFYINSEFRSNSARMNAMTPFANKSHNNYNTWFYKNRVKQKALPVYHDYQHFTANACKDKYIHLRQAGILFLEQAGLRRIFK